MSSEESDVDVQEELVGAVKSANTFAGLLDSDDYDYEEDDEPAPVPVVTSAPPPPPPKPAKSNAKAKKEEDDEYEFLELMRKQQEKTKQEGQPRVSVKKLQFNIAKELADKYGELSFDDSTHIPRNANHSKFIVRRRKWPTVTPLPFKLTETAEGVFNVTLTDYGSESKQLFDDLQANMQMGEMMYVIKRDAFNIWLCMGVGRLAMFRKEFNDATDLDLKLTYVLQQCLPNTVSHGAKFEGPGAVDFFKLLSFIARFAFRRGCFQTSNDIWKFAALGCSSEDPLGVLICAAIPALYAEDKEFVKTMIESEITFRGIPLKHIPDWSVVDALLSVSEAPEKLDVEVAKWPMVFFYEKDEESPVALQMVQVALHRRIRPYLEQDRVEQALGKARKNAEKMNVEDLRRDTAERWKDITIEEDIYSMFVEEDALPVNPEA